MMKNMMGSIKIFVSCFNKAAEPLSYVLTNNNNVIYLLAEGYNKLGDHLAAVAKHQATYKETMLSTNQCLVDIADLQLEEGAEVKAQGHYIFMMD